MLACHGSRSTILASCASPVHIQHTWKTVSLDKDAVTMVFLRDMYGYSLRYAATEAYITVILTVHAQVMSSPIPTCGQLHQHNIHD